MERVIRMDRQEILNQAWETVDEIRSHPAYRDYRTAEAALLEDPLLAPLVREFALAKDAFEPFREEGPRLPGWKAASARLSAAKDALFFRPEYKRYLLAKADLDAELAALSQELQSVLDDVSVAERRTCQKG